MTTTQRPAPRVDYLDEEPNGLGLMVGGLIEGNLQTHPERRALLAPAVAGIVATDAGVAITLRLTPARVTVANGIVARPQVVIRTDSDTLTEMSSVPLRLGLPDPLTREGRTAMGKLRSGELKVKGMLRHPGVLSRLNRLLSVT